MGAVPAGCPTPRQRATVLGRGLEPAPQPVQHRSSTANPLPGPEVVQHAADPDAFGVEPRPNTAPPHGTDITLQPISFRVEPRKNRNTSEHDRQHADDDVFFFGPPVFRLRSVVGKQVVDRRAVLPCW